jgi:glycosyltransferase involved in cell wall biosynthesis
MSTVSIQSEEGLDLQLTQAPGRVDKAASFDPAVRPSKRMLFITFAFPPSMEMGAQSCAQIARYLPLYGWEPIVLTVANKYIEKEYLGSVSDDQYLKKDVVQTEVLPHPFDVYRLVKSLVSSLKTRFVKSGEVEVLGPDAFAEVVDVPKGRARRYLLSLLSVPDMHTGWFLPGVLAGLRTMREKKCELIFSSSPFFTGHLIGYALAQLTRLPWVAHFRDPATWPVAPNERKIPFRILHAFEGMVVKRADRVVSVTREHEKYLRDLYPHCAGEKFSTVPNGFDAEEWLEIEQEGPRTHSVRERKKFRILYAGQIYVQRSPEPVFEALRSLIDAGEVNSEEINFDLVGWCNKTQGRSVADLIAKFNLEGCVNIVGPTSRHETLRRMTQADLLLLLAEGWTLQIPGKTYEYLKAGRPILALTSEGALANFIRATGAGWSLEPTDRVNIRSAIHQALLEAKAGSSSHVPNVMTINSFDRRQTTEQIGKLFDDLLTLKRS